MVEATELINPLILLLTFFAAAVVGSILRERTQALSIRERRSRALNYFTQDIANTVELDQVLQMVGRSLKELLDFNVVIALPHATKPDALVPHAYGECRLSENETAAMYQSMQQKMIAGRSTPFFAGSRYVWIPMVTSQGILGVMGFEGEDQEILPDQRDFKATIVSQTALAVERTIIFSEMSRSLVREEREQLRSALLSSVSHDLKTPLASIIGSLSTVRHMGARLSASQQNELVDSAVDEAERLNSFITNILNMTRLEGEGVQLNQDWHDVRDVVEAACHRMKQNTRGRRQFKLEMPQQDDQIWIDPLLFDQVLQNLLDNAVKYSKPGTNIFISFRKERGKGGAVLTVKDEGVGIPTGKAHKIFDKFARLENRDRQVAGTGLGLSICKSIVEAHGFAIDVKNNKTVGSSFLIHIPSEFWRRGNVQQRA